MRTNRFPSCRPRRCLAAAAVLALLPALVHGAETIPPGGGKDTSPAAIAARVDRALDSGNLETALYAYRSLYHVTGDEDPARLGRIAELVVEDEMRRGGGWLRISAAEILARRGEEEALQVLRDAVGDAEVSLSHRRHAMRVLADLGDAESIPLLKPLVYDEERTMDERFVAADSLLALGDLHGVSFLIRALEGDQLRARLRAATILGDRRVATMGPLRRAAEAEDVRLLALRALALQGDGSAIAALHAEVGEDPVVVVPEISPEDPGPPAEAAAVESRDLRTLSRRLRAAEALMDAGDPRPTAFLAAVARDPESPFNVVEVVKRIEAFDPRLARTLYEEIFAGKGSDLARVNAGLVLVQQGRAEGVLELFRQVYDAALKAGADGVRLKVVEAVAEARLPGSDALLRVVVEEDPSGIHRVRAAAGLAARGDALGLKVLRDHLDGANRVDALKAAEALLETAGGATPEAAGYRRPRASSSPVTSG